MVREDFNLKPIGAILLAVAWQREERLAGGTERESEWTNIVSFRYLSPICLRDTTVNPFGPDVTTNTYYIDDATYADALRKNAYNQHLVTAAAVPPLGSQTHISASDMEEIENKVSFSISLPPFFAFLSRISSLFLAFSPIQSFSLIRFLTFNFLPRCRRRAVQSESIASMIPPVPPLRVTTFNTFLPIISEEPSGHLVWLLISINFECLIFFIGSIYIYFLVEQSIFYWQKRERKESGKKTSKREAKQWNKTFPASNTEERQRTADTRRDNFSVTVFNRENKCTM